MNKTAVVFFLLLLIVLVWLYTTGRIQAAVDAISGRKVLA